MALSLQAVPARQGALWLRDGFRLFSKYPLAFSLLFVMFMAAVFVSAAVPYIGSLIMLSAVPVLGLGFMVASAAALDKERIHPGQFLAAFKVDAQRRNAQIVLCIAFGALTVAILWVANQLDDGAFEKLQRLLAEQAPQAKIDELLSDGSLQQGLIARFGLASLLSAIFWHAPALVHWGNQGAAQALFSSTLAMWRNKGAFLVYMMSWLAIISIFGMLTALTLGLLGMKQLTGLLALPAGLILSTVFYVSLIFTFKDCFGNSGIDKTQPQNEPLS